MNHRIRLKSFEELTSALLAPVTLEARINTPGDPPPARPSPRPHGAARRDSEPATEPYATESMKPSANGAARSWRPRMAATPDPRYDR